MIVPVEEFPPNTVVGITVKDCRPTDVIVRFEVAEVPFKAPVMIAVVCVFTPNVETLKVAVV